MQTLLNSLVNGTTEYLENGDIVQHPPTAVMLRAARELTTLLNINTTNGEAIRQLQFRVEEQLNEITILQENINESRRAITELTTDLQNLRNDTGQDGAELNIEVGRSGEQSSGSDSDGEGCGTN